MKVKNPQAKPKVNKTTQAASVVAQASVAKQDKAHKLHEPPAPKGRSAEPFVGTQIAAQIARISLLNGTDPETGSVAYTRPLNPADRFDKVGVFFEAEAKVTPIDDADIPAIKARVLEAGDSGNAAALLPKGSRFANLSLKWDRPNSREGAQFHDVYGDDAGGNLAKARCQARERKIGDTQDGKFESKLPAADIQGTAVLGRLECAKSTGPTRRSKESIIAEAVTVLGAMKHIKDPNKRAEHVAKLSLSERENPLVLVGVEVPAFDPSTFADRIVLDARRHQLVMQDGTGKDMFLMTLDFVHAKRIESKKTADYVEFEIERMDGSTSKPGLSELIELTNAVAQALSLTKSPAPKSARGMMLTE